VAADAHEVIEYAKYLGIEPLKEPHLLRIAQVRQKRCPYPHKRDAFSPEKRRIRPRKAT
jgi:hypothetical protein